MNNKQFTDFVRKTQDKINAERERNNKCRTCSHGIDNAPLWRCGLTRISSLNGQDVCAQWVDIMETKVADKVW